MVNDAGHCHFNVNALCEGHPFGDPFLTREEFKIRPHHAFRSYPFDDKFGASVTPAHHDCPGPMAKTGAMIEEIKFDISGQPLTPSLERFRSHPNFGNFSELQADHVALMKVPL